MVNKMTNNFVVIRRDIYKTGLTSVNRTYRALIGFNIKNKVCISHKYHLGLYLSLNLQRSLTQDSFYIHFCNFDKCVLQVLSKKLFNKLVLKLSSFKTEFPAEFMINLSVQNFIPCFVLLLYSSKMRSTKKKKKKR